MVEDVDDNTNGDSTNGGKWQWWKMLLTILKLVLCNCMTRE